MDFAKSFLKRLKRLISQRRTILSLATLLSAYFFLKSYRSRIATVKLSYFLLALSENRISEVIISGSRLKFLTNSTWHLTDTSLLTKDRLFKLLKDKENLVFSSMSPPEINDNIFTQLVVFGASLFAGYLLVNYMDLGGAKGMGPKDYKSSLVSHTKFSDVYGLVFAKKELQEIIDFLKDPEKYENIGARLRRGVLIYGPPGTGKTLLAKATAGESNSSFLYCTASEFVEIYVGMGQKRVRELFDQARKCSPCIIFIDEIDGIGMRRERNFAGDGGADMERSSTLNQLLAEMDGFRENEKIIVVAATNRVLCLDDALLRSGRFDTKIKVELPNEEERFGIVKLHLKKKKEMVNDDKMIEIAKNSRGYSGADLENIVNESAYIAIQNKRNIIENQDLEDSFVKIKSQKEAKQNDLNCPMSPLKRVLIPEDFLTRAEKLKKKLIPASTEQKIIVKSNKEGLGFRFNCYPDQILHDVITKESFDFTVKEANKICQNAWTEKKKHENIDFHPLVNNFYRAAISFTILGLFLLIIHMYSNSGFALFPISFVFIGFGCVLMLFIAFISVFSEPNFIGLEKTIRIRLQRFLKEENDKKYKDLGFEWRIEKDFFWLELVNLKKRVNVQENELKFSFKK